MAIEKRKFKCTECGEDRPCHLEINQEPSPSWDVVIDELKCVLDETNQTSYNWEEISGRKEAMSWWNSKSQQEKEELCSRFFIDRNQNSLTGSEIEMMLKNLI